MLSINDLKTLSEPQEGPVVSIFMPTHMAGKDTRENPIRFKNRLHEAETQLSAHGLRDDAVRDLLKPLYALVDDYPFWQNQRHGLALFCSAQETHTHLLPITPDELTVVAPRYHLKPLIPIVSGDGRYTLLAVSLNAVHLFEATRYSVNALELAGPKSLEEALKYDDLEKHKDARDVSPGRAGQQAQFFGHGPGEEDHKAHILRFFKELDNNVRHVLQNSNAPLVFAGVEYLFPIYQEANHYQHLFAHPVTGNPDELRPEELQTRSWEVVAPHFEASLEKALGRHAQQQGTGQASEALPEVVFAAFDGRVDILFVALGEQRWGHVDLEARTTEHHDEEHAGDEDLLDTAAVQTLLNGGRVYPLPADDVPGHEGVAAIFRY